MGSITVVMTYKTLHLRIENPKGLYLAAEIDRPEAAGTFPAVFMFHGFTGYKEGADLVDLAHRLASSGIVAVRFTASGFGDSEGTLSGDYRFSNHRKDAESIYTYVSALPYVDSAHIGVYGHSMGGKLAVLFCYDHADIRALCAVSAPVEFSGTMYGAMEEEWKKKRYFEKVSSRDGKTIRVPYEYRVDADAQKHDVLEAARHVATPHALIIAGEKDTEVPWQETQKIFDALNCPKTWLLLENIDHQYKRNAQLLPVVHEPVVSFFVKYLLQRKGRERKR